MKLDCGFARVTMPLVVMLAIVACGGGSGGEESSTDTQAGQLAPQPEGAWEPAADVPMFPGPDPRESEDVADVPVAPTTGGSAGNATTGGVAVSSQVPVGQISGVGTAGQALPAAGGQSAAPQQPPANSTQGQSAAKKARVKLDWNSPRTRVDGTQLKSSDVVGYIIVLLREADIGKLGGKLDQKIRSRKLFHDSGDNIGQFLRNVDVAQMVAEGSPNAIIVSSPQTSYSIDLPAGEAHFAAVSAYDWQGLYSPLSETIEVLR